MGKPFPYNVRVNGKHGAPMGRVGAGGGGHDEYVKLNCRRVPLDQGYDGGGAYWGCNTRGEMLFCAWSADRSVIRYGRASSYLMFQQSVSEDYPGADFL